MLTNIKSLKIIYLIFFILFVNQVTIANENTIVFKVKNTSYTTIDLDIRKKYLNFLGANSNISDKSLIDDFISVAIFNEYFLSLNVSNNLEIKINEIYNNIKNENDKLGKNISFDIDEKELKKNIRLDLIRKNILEQILNSQKEKVFSNINSASLLYDYELTYYNLDINDLNSNKKIVDFNIFSDENNLRNYLDKENTKYYQKKVYINDLSTLRKFIKTNIENNKLFFTKRNDDKITFFYIKKKFKTYDGLIASIISFTYTDLLTKEQLLCENIQQFNGTQNSFISKDYEYIKLNKQVQESLLSVNDYIYIQNESIYTYIILCGLKFDEEILNTANVNKKVSTLVEDIEINFVNKYSKIYNVVFFNE